MSAVCFVGDCHVGNHRALGGPLVAGLNTRCREVVAVLRRSVERAQELDASAFVVLGDLFDTDRPSPQIVAAVQDALTLGGEADIPVWLLLGNHDMTSATPGDHALAPLDGYGLIKVVECPKVITTGGVALVMVPFEVGPASTWLPLEAEREAKHVGLDKRVLCTHVGIIDGSTPPWLRNAADAVTVDLLNELRASAGLTHAIAGNWHSRKLWGNVMQVGALVPTGWDNPGLEGYGTLAILDGDTWRWEELPGPRFIKLSAGKEPPTTLAGTRLYARVLTPPGTGEAEAASLKDYGLAGYEIEIDTGEAEASARTAAMAARSEETLEASLAGFVAAMELPSGVERATVLERCRGYLK